MEQSARFAVYVVFIARLCIKQLPVAAALLPQVKVSLVLAALQSSVVARVFSAAGSDNMARPHKLT